MSENETFEIFFAKSAKEKRGGGSENSGKNPLFQTRCICGLSFSWETASFHIYFYFLILRGCLYKGPGQDNKKERGQEARPEYSSLSLHKLFFTFI